MKEGEGETAVKEGDGEWSKRLGEGTVKPSLEPNGLWFWKGLKGEEGTKLEGVCVSVMCSHSPSPIDGTCGVSPDDPRL